MGRLHTRQSIEVDTEYDLVVFRVGHAEEKFSYMRAANIAQDMRVCAKMAMHYEGENVAGHRAMTYGAGAQQEAMAKSLEDGVHNGARRSRAQPHNRTGVAWSGAEVRIQIGNTTIGMHWRDALTVSGWFRVRAKEAKRWAGDSSKRLRLSGLLTDASQKH